MFEFWVRVEPNYSYPLKEFSLEKSEGFQSLFFLSQQTQISEQKIFKTSCCRRYVYLLTLLVAVKRGALPQDVFRI